MFAQDSDDERQNAVRRHMERGRDFYVQARNVEAAAEFLAAYELQPHAAFLYNAAISFERDGAYDRALALYQRYVDAAVRNAEREQGQEALGRMRSALGQDSPGANPDDPNAPETPEATPQDRPDSEDMKSLLTVETNPAGAMVTVRRGDEIIVQAPSPFNESFDEGSYEISVAHPNFQTITHELQVSSGHVYVAVLELSQGNFAGILRVESDPPGASVFVGDREGGALGQTPFQNVLPIGQHHVWVERPGYDTVELDVNVELGSVVTQEVSLERSMNGRLRVTSNQRGADVYVNGELLGQVPLEVDVPAGTHEIEVSHGDRKDYEGEITIARGQLTPILVDMAPAVSRVPAWMMLIGSLAVAGGGVAMYFYGQQLREGLNPALGKDDPNYTKERGVTYGSYAAFSLAGVLFLTSIYYFLRNPGPDSTADVFEPRDWTLLPDFGPRRAQLTLTAHF